MITLSKKIIVAVDGYSSCGKSSFAKLIARELGYIYLDSGAMYRSVALYALRNNLLTEDSIHQQELLKKLPEMNIRFTNRNGETTTFLNDENVEKDIRGVEVSAVVSKISSISEVRSILVQLQQKMGTKKGIVMDGRDIGTVVFPNAEIKIFMTAETLSLIHI